MSRPDSSLSLGATSCLNASSTIDCSNSSQTEQHWLRLGATSLTFDSLYLNFLLFHRYFILFACLETKWRRITGLVPEIVRLTALRTTVVARAIRPDRQKLGWANLCSSCCRSLWLAACSRCTGWASSSCKWFCRLPWTNWIHFDCLVARRVRCRT